MLAKRIIPCLDVKDGRTVKGVNFDNLRDAGDIVELASLYSGQGADELVFLDISASSEHRRTMPEWVARVAAEVAIPFTVGGGVSSVEDVEMLLQAGADKVSINTSALADPGLITRMAHAFGRQCVVVAVDAKQETGRWCVYSHGGRVNTGRELFEWCREAEQCGAGEILFTSMDNDGVKQGFACEALAALSSRLTIPVIASGGAGCTADFHDAFTLGCADAALAAGIFHYGETTINEVKQYLKNRGIEVRI